jgi:hypothetical protein
MRKRERKKKKMREKELQNKFEHKQIEKDQKRE